MIRVESQRWPQFGGAFGDADVVGRPWLTIARLDELPALTVKLAQAMAAKV